MSLNPYLTFDGNCREVFQFYRSVFGGDFSMIQTFGEAPPDMKFPDAEKDRILHVSLPIGSSTLMGSDSSAAFGPPPVAGTNFSISVNAETKTRADELMAMLSEGGDVRMPMADTFWGAYFGMCTDQYGISWMISHSPVQT